MWEEARQAGLLRYLSVEHRAPRWGGRRVLPRPVSGDGVNGRREVVSGVLIKPEARTSARM